MKLNRYLALVLVFFLFACQPAVPSTLTLTTTTNIPPSTIALTEVSVLESDCKPPSTSSASSMGGGILFYEQVISSNSDNTTRVWLWSNNIATPKLVLEKDFFAQFYLSPDGEKHVWHVHDSDYFTVYDLISKNSDNFPWQAEWQTITGWKENDIVSILSDYKKIYNEGITSKYINYDVKTLSFTVKEIALELPGYTEDQSSHDPQDGFAATDPTNTLVLYTGDEKIILMDIKSGESLWEEYAHWPLYPYPVWTSDGDHVVFVINNEHPTIYSATRDGKTIKKIGDGQKQRVIRDIKLSQNGNYVYYTYWTTINEGPAYIINLTTKETKEICNPGFTFLDGHWLTDDHFVYIVRDNTNISQPGNGEIHILDVKNWNFTTVFKTTKKIVTAFELPILGWTPFPNP